MLERKDLFGDNEYIIMSEIAENEKITQRELSKKMGVSVSTVNILISKMLREGLIKMTQVSQKQMLYMLTPAGMMEKARKTVSYLKIHYRAIYEIQKKTKEILEELIETHDVLIVLLSKDEIWEIIGVEIDKFRLSNKQHSMLIIEDLLGVESSITKLNHIKAKAPVLLYMTTDESNLNINIKVENLKVINLAEWL